MGKMLNTRQFGRSDLQISEVGFGAWGIGGPAMAGQTPIGFRGTHTATTSEAEPETDGTR